ncbi:hypothetical protein NQ314_016011 [Rhamnusium bicolor]|uniref:Uncharacterized protein n=1 Tax=Rhamnusium bicolor TaxID=1586634 RepID=A0AAV8WYD7_9CUCU|nr:hypothetical protein NQ314_016011 [Rhamnusium bicolor]
MLSGIYPISKDKILEKSISATLLNSSENQIQPSISLVENENETSEPDFVGCNQSSPSSTPKHQKLDDITPTKKLELSLMSVLRRQESQTLIQKRSRLRRKFAETLTAEDVR